MSSSLASAVFARNAVKFSSVRVFAVDLTTTEHSGSRVSVQRTSAGAGAKPIFLAYSSARASSNKLPTPSGEYP
eukprot:CAMPEP_0179617382 /NCGR_PEP_ID=MMETSP0930-20121108/7128_1 /TAXON_ID=548131 ORGANISM="Ostreococcus mediterraneus, Strain clade-D-RCC1621" /NCGR_SAMPLE_ID=MMETSP0930 /ASSEMBLY_ACC=CAM_ASM_000580 /LENGTH=73 /DNA_ID=CAMNT_0021486281 /DNA_START=147 /DNA_END=368 /DNA_ORIENTATION=+